MKTHFVLESSAVDEIKNVICTFQKRGQFKGLGGELMKQACAVFIKKCSIVHFPIHCTNIIGISLYDFFFFFIYINR